MFFILFFFIVRIIRLHLDSLVSFYVLLYLRSQPFKTCASSTFNSSMQPVSGMNILIIFFLGFLFRMCTNTIFKVVALRQWDTFRCIIGCISTTRITSGGNKKSLYAPHQFHKCKQITFNPLSTPVDPSFSIFQTKQTLCMIYFVFNPHYNECPSTNSFNCLFFWFNTPCNSNIIDSFFSCCFFSSSICS